MSEHITDEEQVEELKKWWKENSRAIIIGVVIGLAGVFGWKSWNNYQEQMGQQASMQYQQALHALDRGAHEELDGLGNQLVTEYSDTPYAALAKLAMAKGAFDLGDQATAQAHLQWVLDNGADQEVKQIASLRLSRLLLAAGELDRALALVSNSKTGAFSTVFLEQQGDVYQAMNEFQKAAEAYQVALDKSRDGNTFLQIKLDDAVARQVGAGK